MARVQHYGIWFASGIEGDRYLVLRDMARTGEIVDLAAHPRFEIQAAGRDAAGKKIASRSYTADFQYTRVSDGRRVVEEVKPANARARSRTNAGWRLRYDAARVQNPDIEFQIVYM